MSRCLLYITYYLRQTIQSFFNFSSIESITYRRVSSQYRHRGIGITLLLKPEQRAGVVTLARGVVARIVTGPHEANST